MVQCAYGAYMYMPMVPIGLRAYVAFVNGGYMPMVPAIPMVATSVHLHAYAA